LSENDTVPEMIEKGYSDLMNSWFVQHYTEKINHEGYQTAETVATDSDYISRLASLPYVVPLPYNPVVGRCIEQYVGRRRNLVEYMLGLETVYFPMIEETLDRYGLPIELKYLAVIESALNPTALSRAGAAGLWQFILPTGKLYGLEINSLIDERLDPVKETDAACRLLRDLHKIYNDWTLAIAAYNCGGGNVNKAIRRAGGKTDFWEIYPYLPRETRMYVRFFIAAAYAMNFYPYHRLYPVKLTMQSATDTVTITQPIHLEQIAAVLNIDSDALRSINPQYKKDIIPGDYKPMALTLPVERINDFLNREDEIAAYNRDTYFPQQSTASTTITGKTVKITHTVKKGETVAKIGGRYGVSASNIRKWNKLGSKVNALSAGRKLTLYVVN